MEIKDIFDMVIGYGLPSIAIVISIASYYESRKVNKVQLRVNELEVQLKRYELEEKEKEREAVNKSTVEARIYNVSRGKYKLKIWNSGQAPAYHVDYEVPGDLMDIVMKDKVPYEILEPGKSFEEHISHYMGMPTKLTVKTVWKEANGELCEKEQIVSF